MSSTMRAAVEAASGAFHEALRTNDAERFLSYVDDDVVMMPPGEPTIRGKEALRTWFTGFLAVYQTTALTLSDREVITADGWAVELGTYEWALSPTGGGAPIVDLGNYMQVWKQRADGQWRFAREIWNSSIPAEPPA